MTNPLTGLATARRGGSPYGITSICSAHPLVIQSAIRRAVADTDSMLLIEATCNQVNQFGGYTGMTPDLFVAFVQEIASREGLQPSRIIFGGDHLGPNPWRSEPAAQAMAKAEAMVTAYVWAGFSKIHLDASMGCAGEPAALDDETIAARAARLAKAAEKAARAKGGALPLYIIGTEVPVPGGADHALSDLKPTEAAAARRTIEIHREIFAREGLGEAFGRVIALVVQPGVEFGSENVIAYKPEASKALTALLDEQPSLVYEAHSTDYQSRAALAALVANGFPILKVGPGLTFALREALYGLDLIAAEMVPGYGDRSLARTMERVMLAAPGHWRSHYHGGETSLYLQRHYSYSDRIRYYWSNPAASVAVGRLREVLTGVDIPETLMRQFLPTLPAGLGPASDPEAILLAAVDAVLADYEAACRGG
ncbi:D-tagatose-bisphosphate aldolase, class II, non-catalytic subunit [Mesorhizobium sp. M4B.F.Ca.ET.215.01.1.1]|uniref:D-tagatose-bisphosphate aldolase, class II, non-catalytic subunit n=6 Tax=Mesorhizobium TaxID=68287 RepID=A0ABU5ATN9_9HYPH|nr:MULTISPECIES: D-tagatose-bisphosphate aldolase, class II, non-catalytic subunit [Mesorhizobium]RVC59667.1 D-tagatose-bisphosphate aldolase, class II, non-catalytic subunit [Mesorhizobium sp. M4B.F.Ca.ET.088.02.2.1]MDX8540655.1 D-tagatose-bisphosphate aldolase, class II, non-catalytic subunit [Mesorhizobium abyssinicae]RUW21087.1 D-tagatose-bisphosphate aldolase, class II, non-catalytic subunit [Mesorhizobium sp. M4B.F.Ca.ET.013.02.1.1]RVD41245.1 D-tagatose-bisphosphate aldolase, class II, no